MILSGISTASVPSSVIDTHCHLTFPEFAENVSEELALADQHGVTGCITIATTSQDSLRTLALAKQHDRVWCTAGVHPLYSDQEPHDWEAIEQVGRDPRCVAFGELGLDNHYDEPAPQIQHRVLDEQLARLESFRSEDGEAALGKPIVIHCREAFDDLIPILRASSISPERFVFHCFTGNPVNARAVLDFGACLSFTGVVTYKNAVDVQDAAKVVPADRLMVETDAPFLSPAPHRGKRPCRTWMTSLTARFLADLRGEDWNTFHQTLNATTRRFFGIEAR